MRRKGILLCVVGMFILGILLTSCNSSSNTESGQEKIELEFVNWATAEDVSEDKINEVISEFESENPNITVKSQSIGFADIQDKLTVRSTTGDAPDIAQIPPEVGGGLMSSEVLEPVDDLLSEDFSSNLLSSYYDTGKLDDEHYLIPWAGGVNGFWYNKKIMEEAGMDPNQPPETIEELDNAMAKVKEVEDVVPLQYDITPRAFSTLFQWSFMETMGSAPFDEKTSQMDEMDEYANWLRNLVDKDYTVPGKKIAYFRELAAQGRVAFGFDNPFLKETIQDLNSMSDDEFFDTWGVTNLPSGESGENYTVGGSDHYLAIFKDSEHKEEAAKFVEHLVNSDIVLENYILPMGMLPVTEDATERFPEFEEDEITEKFINDIVPNTVRVPFSSNFNERASIIGTYMQDIASKSEPIEDILDKGQKELEDSAE